MLIEQTVDIPADHRLVLDVPREVPAGRAILTFTPQSGVSAHAMREEWDQRGGTSLPTLDALKRQAAEKTALRKKEGRQPFNGLYGALKNSTAFTGDPVEVVRTWRDEWESSRECGF